MSASFENERYMLTEELKSNNSINIEFSKLERRCAIVIFSFLEAGRGSLSKPDGDTQMTKCCDSSQADLLTHGIE